jgi:hypothetical protein
VLTDYQKKIDVIHTSWQKEKETLEFVPTVDPTGHLKDELTQHVRKFQKLLDRSEKYANNIIEMETKRAKLIDELKEKEDKSANQRKNYIKNRDQKLKHQADVYEEKLKKIEEKNQQEYRERRMKDKMLKTRLYSV